MPRIHFEIRITSFVITVLMLAAASGSYARSSDPAAPRADEFAAEYREAQSVQPPGVRLTIRFAGERRAFTQGEVIRVELVFSCAAPCGYNASTAAYDRSGRLEIDDYHIDREDAVDPLADYFHSGISGFMGGGLSSDADLGKSSFSITQELNEWLRFDEPGRYRLYVTSRRVAKKRDLFLQPPRGNPLVVMSNVLEFDVLPASPAWRERKLAEAAAVLDASRRADNGARDERRQAACRTLRFLGTTRAAQEMIRRWRGEDDRCDGEFAFGLVGSPHRSSVIDEMERRLVAPDQPVTPRYLYTLALLSVLENPAASLPPFPAGQGEAAKAWQAQAERRRAIFERTTDDYAARLAEAVSGKQGAARAVTLGTLLGRESDGSSATPTAAWRRKLAAMLPEVFFDLPRQTRAELLGYRWREVASPAMLPVLRRAYDTDSPGTDRELRGLALLRLYRLAPAEGRELMLAEIGRLRPRVSFAALERLPDETPPELDDRLATNLERSDAGESGTEIPAAGQPAQPVEHIDLVALHSRLVERYATAAVLPRVRAIFDRHGAGRRACAEQAALLAYFLRVEPRTGESLLRRSLASRGHTGCYRSLLDDVARLHMSAELEEVAADALADPDPEIVASAAAVLGGYGSAAAEDRLWRRLEEWHRRWSGRAAELDRFQPGAPSLGAPPAAGQMLIENRLVTALGTARSWLLDADRAERLRSLAVTRAGEQIAAVFAGARDHVISVSYRPDDDRLAVASVAQYKSDSIERMKEKLAQYPAGTVFVWSRSGLDAEDDARLRAEIKQYVERHGMKLADDAP